MSHHTTTDFWACYNQLPDSVRKRADANYDLLKTDSHHPSLHFKRVGKLWSVRVGIAFGSGSGQRRRTDLVLDRPARRV
jgi:hypothetical protein